MTTCASLCVCKKEAGTASVTLPSTVFLIISAFSSPHAVRNILRAERMVSIPIVMEHGGTVSCEPKLIFISSRAVSSIRMSREVDVRLDPGSLVAMFPIRPIPRRITSIPPSSFIKYSYWRQYSCTLS